MGTYCCSATQTPDADKLKLKPKSIRKSADLSKFAAKLQELQREDRVFIDTEFPARRESIIRNAAALEAAGEAGAKYEAIADTTWKRAEEIPCLLNGEGNLTLFLDDIEPNDIRMGGLDDAHFLSMLSGLAEVPERIRDIFISPVVNPQGLFGVRLVKDGVMQEVLVDGLIPVTEDDELQFSKTHGPELWVIMLEKAYAKLKGDYLSIGCGGRPEHAITELTGAPWMKFYTSETNAEDFFNSIFEYDTKEYVMSTSIAPQAGRGNEHFEELTSLGLQASHAYTLLGCASVVDSDGNDARIVCIRNPWGRFEWNGDWSDDSRLWTDEAKELVGFVAGEDGVFWMSFEDWQKYFVDLVVCMYKEQFKYSSIRMNHICGKNEHNFLIKFDIEKPGEYTFGWHMSDTPDSPNHRTTKFTVVHFPQQDKMTSKKLLGDDLPNVIIGEQECCGNEREHYINCERCVKGIYIVHVCIEMGDTVLAADVKHAFSAYGPASLILSTDVQEFKTMESWNTQYQQLKYKEAAAKEAGQKA